MNSVTLMVLVAMASIISCVEAVEFGDIGDSSESASNAFCRLKLDRRDRFGAAESRLPSKSRVCPSEVKSRRCGVGFGVMIGGFLGVLESSGASRLIL